MLALFLNLRKMRWTGMYLNDGVEQVDCHKCVVVWQCFRKKTISQEFLNEGWVNGVKSYCRNHKMVNLYW